jgi:hypothetical protein
MIYQLLLIFLFFSGCYNHSIIKKNKKNNIIQKKYKKIINLRVTNLHCKLCAYNLVKFIAKIDGVLNVKFNYVARNYQQSYFSIEIDSRKTTLDQVTIPLIKAGFFVQTDQKNKKAN